MKNKFTKQNKPKPRGVWKINPKSRVKPSEKVYRRPKAKTEIQEETNLSS